MQNLENRQGVSEVVTVILVIMISVALVAVLFSVVNKSVRNTALSPEFDCAKFNIAPSVIIKDACFNLSSEEAEILIERINKNPEIAVIEFVLDYETENEKYTCGERCLNCEVLDSGSKKYYFDVSKKPEKVNIIIDGCVLRAEKEVREC